MATTLIALFSIVVLYSAVLKFAGWYRRYRAITALDLPDDARVANGVDVVVMLRGKRPLRGIMPNRTNRVKGNLAITADRFVMATNKGVLADIGHSHGRKFTSVRSTGPGRLVMEGDVPYPDKTTGVFRFEMVVDDAPAWIEALKPFSEETKTAADFSRPPRDRKASPGGGTSPNS